MRLPLNTIKVKPENICDVCKKNIAQYYNITYYIHACSIECFKTFIEGYNREIEEISRKLLDPDETDEIGNINSDL